MIAPGRLLCCRMTRDADCVNAIHPSARLARKRSRPEPTPSMTRLTLRVQFMTRVSESSKFLFLRGFTYADSS